MNISRNGRGIVATIGVISYQSYVEYSGTVEGMNGINGIAGIKVAEVPMIRSCIAAAIGKLNNEWQASMQGISSECSNDGGFNSNIIMSNQGINNPSANGAVGDNQSIRIDAGNGIGMSRIHQ